MIRSNLSLSDPVARDSSAERGPCSTKCHHIWTGKIKSHGVWFAMPTEIPKFTRSPRAGSAEHIFYITCTCNISSWPVFHPYDIRFWLSAAQSCSMRLLLVLINDRVPKLFPCRHRTARINSSSIEQPLARRRSGRPSRRILVLGLATSD